MIIYLAGGITGNLIGDWKKIMEIYLASLSNEKKRLDEIINCFLLNEKKRDSEIMEIFLAGGIGEKKKIFLAGNDGDRKDRFKIRTRDLNILESFYYVKSQEWMFPLIKQFNNF